MESEPSTGTGPAGVPPSMRRPAERVGPEVDSRAVGVDPAGIDRALALVRRRGAVAQLFVVRDGQVIVDRSFDCSPDALFWTFSAGKPCTAVLTHVLVEQGLVELGTPVADHWPAFGGHGKGGITVRQVLTPGTPLPELLRTLLLAPLAARDTHLGLNDDLLRRAVPVVGSGPVAAVAARRINRPSTRLAVAPSAGVSTTARDLVTFYAMLLDGGVAGDGTRILQPGTIAAEVAPTSDGELDRYAKAPIRWTAGFQLGGLCGIPGRHTPIGDLSSPRSFGHNGSSCCIGWADPDRRLVYAYLTNRFGGRADLAHHAAVADALLAATGDGDA